MRYLLILIVTNFYFWTAVVTLAGFWCFVKILSLMG